MEHKTLELLFEYTKFHIGIYLTLAAVYITLGTSRISGSLPKVNQNFVWPAVFSIAFAGFSGGVIASSITQTQAPNVTEFLKEQTGPWNTHLLTVLNWTYIEHTAFWLGIAFIMLSFKFRKRVPASTFESNL
jgi:hypothetical protein